MNAPTDIATLKQAGGALAMPADQAIDMFTERGFALANRVAKAYSSSSAVPAQFQEFNLKRSGSGQTYKEEWVQNPGAIGNCLVAIEVARAVRMSIVAVMQNADMIEGKLRWSGKFVIAAINASGRFTPLRFQMKNLGKIKAKYKEKGGWNNAERRYNMIEHEVEVENTECIAWALPKGFPEPKLSVEQMREYRGRMLDLYEDLGLPVIKSAKVTTKLAVEEGWYAKPGSKWQTEMKELMFQYRTGSFFGNIHAPDVVMGMTQTSEEARDLAGTFDVDEHGVATPVPLDHLRDAPPRATQMADEVKPAARQTETVDADSGEINRGGEAPVASPSGATAAPAFDGDAFAEKLEACRDLQTLDLMGDEIRQLAKHDADLAAVLNDVYQRCRAALAGAQDSAAASAPAPRTASRRTASRAQTDTGGDPRPEPLE